MTGHRILGTIAGTMAGLLLLMVLTLVIQTYQLAQQNARLNERIVDCTTPGRPCFEAGQQRTAEAVSLLNQYTEAAVACADQEGSQPRPVIRACILRTLE